MPDVPIPPEQVQDPVEKNIPGLGVGRDPERTPMQWDSSPNAAFTAGTPWLPLASDFPTVNVAAERDDPESMLSLYRALIDLRQSEAALMVGSYAPVPADGDLLAYIREAEGQRFLIVLNFSSREQLLAAPEGLRGNVILSTHLDRDGEAMGDAVELRPDEGVVVRLR